MGSAFFRLACGVLVVEVLAFSLGCGGADTPVDKASAVAPSPAAADPATHAAPVEPPPPPAPIEQPNPPTEFAGPDSHDKVVEDLLAWQMELRDTLASVQDQASSRQAAEHLSQMLPRLDAIAGRAEKLDPPSLEVRKQLRDRFETEMQSLARDFEAQSNRLVQQPELQTAELQRSMLNLGTGALGVMTRIQPMLAVSEEQFNVATTPGPQWKFERPTARGDGAEPTSELKGGERPIKRLAISPDGSQVAAAADDGRIYVWDTKSGQPTAVLSGFEQTPEFLVFNHDGTRLVAGNETIQVWDLANGRPAQSIRVARAIVAMGAASPTENVLACASSGGSVIGLINLNSSEVQEIPVQGLKAAGMAFSPDGKHLALGSYNDLKLLEVATGKEIWSSNWDGYGTMIAFAGANELITFNRKNVRVFDSETGKEKGQYPQANIYGEVGISPDGKFLAITGMSKNRPTRLSKVWPVRK